MNYQWKKQGFYTRFFQTNSALVLLINLSRDGLIVDTGPSTLDSYDYSHDTMCQKHTWEINALGCHMFPIIHEIAHLPDGHEPLHFIHKLADGISRHIQTYAGPIEIYGNKLILRTIHGITEQERLEQELKRAVPCDTLTGLLNRQRFYQVAEPEQTHATSLTQDYSLLLIDTGRFESINSLSDHLKGGEVLCALTHTPELCVRKDDLIFRREGGEFVLLLPRTSLDTALSLAKVIRATVAKVAFPGLPRFTVSIDVTRHGTNESADESFKCIDDVLCKAKNKGRDRVLAT